MTMNKPKIKIPQNREFILGWISGQKKYCSLSVFMNYTPIMLFKNELLGNK